MIGKMKRVILFVKDMKTVTGFYRDKLGLKPIISTEWPPSEWIEFDAGGVNVALHSAPKPGGGARCRTKIVFYGKDVAKARAKLVKKGVKMGELHRWDDLHLCDGSDPEGNRFQISNRA